MKNKTVRKNINNNNKENRFDQKPRKEKKKNREEWESQARRLSLVKGVGVGGGRCRANEKVKESIEGRNDAP